MKSVSGILLAAGSSERFGSEKLLAILPSGERLLERALKVHLLSKISPLVVVVSPKLGNIIREHTGLFSFSKIRIGRVLDQWYGFSSQWGSGRLAVNENCQRGISTSIQKGISCLKHEERTDGVLVSLSDLPLLTSETINFFIHEYFKEKAEILVPLFNESTGHPVIFDINQFKADLGNIEGDVGLRVLIKKYPWRVKKIRWQDDSVTWDIDAPRDLERLKPPG